MRAAFVCTYVCKLAFVCTNERVCCTAQALHVLSPRLRHNKTLSHKCVSACTLASEAGRLAERSYGKLACTRRLRLTLPTPQANTHHCTCTTHRLNGASSWPQGLPRRRSASTHAQSALGQEKSAAQQTREARSSRQRQVLKQMGHSSSSRRSRRQQQQSHVHAHPNPQPCVRAPIHEHRESSRQLQRHTHHVRSQQGVCSLHGGAAATTEQHLQMQSGRHQAKGAVNHLRKAVRQQAAASPVAGQCPPLNPRRRSCGLPGWTTPFRGH